MQEKQVDKVSSVRNKGGARARMRPALLLIHSVLSNYRIPDLEAEQTESLIGINSGEHEA